MSLDSPRIPALLLAPGALAGLLLLQVSGLRRIAFRAALHTVRASEATLAVDPCVWHEYDLEWRQARATFRVDGAPVLEAESPPQGPLGFVAWIDNQFAVLSPQAGLHFGVIPTDTDQQLELEQLQTQSLEGS